MKNKQCKVKKGATLWDDKGNYIELPKGTLVTIYPLTKGLLAIRCSYDGHRGWISLNDLLEV